eukprot:TRINITY_DN40543_c0_g1_i1.p1 TRINITY_DN40543_c0_g1~~TRINITY_DN40543_c0_g1_i1.p1  ORF type:complete len:420 (-),score=87.78 TRINITY_DN40543_c0_g1_i1:413-1672(-)
MLLCGLGRSARAAPFATQKTADDEVPAAEVLPSRERRDPTEEAEELVRDFCGNIPLTRVVPTSEELDVLWVRCSLLPKRAVVDAVYSCFLSFSTSDDCWQEQLRLVQALLHFYCKGEQAAALARLVMSESADLVKHLVAEVPECCADASQLLALAQVCSSTSSSGQEICTDQLMQFLQEDVQQRRRLQSKDTPPSQTTPAKRPAEEPARKTAKTEQTGSSQTSGRPERGVASASSSAPSRTAVAAADAPLVDLLGMQAPAPEVAACSSKSSGVALDNSGALGDLVGLSGWPAPAVSSRSPVSTAVSASDVQAAGNLLPPATRSDIIPEPSENERQLALLGAILATAGACPDRFNMAEDDDDDAEECPDYDNKELEDMMSCRHHQPPSRALPALFPNIHEVVFAPRSPDPFAFVQEHIMA